MAFQFDLKKAGDLIKSTDWNTLNAEVARLGNDKTDRSGDTLQGDLTVTGKVTCSGDLSVAGVSTLSGHTSVAGPLTVAGATTCQNTLSVTGLATVSAGLSVSGTLSVNGNSLLRGNTSVDGNVGIGTATPESTLQLKSLTVINEGATATGAWANFGSNTYYDGSWKRLDATKAGVNLHINSDAAGSEFRFFREEPNGANQRNIAALGTSTSFIAEGNVGIGTTTPKAKLQVVGGAIMPAVGNAETAGIVFPPNPGGGGGDTAWLRYYSRGGESMTLELGIANDPDDHLTLFASGHVIINRLQLGTKWLLSGVGDAYTNDDWLRLMSVTPTPPTYYYGGFATEKLWSSTGQVLRSDARLKKNITPLSQCLSSLLTLQGVQFTWKDEQNPHQRQIGLLAQQVEAVFPELVSLGPDGMKALNYAGLVAPLIEAIKEQQARIERLEEALRTVTA